MFVGIHASEFFEDQLWVSLQKLFLVTPKTVIHARYDLVVLVQLPVAFAGLSPHLHLFSSLK